MLETGAWLANAQHANECARYFRAQLAGIAHVSVVSPVEANSVFIAADAAVLDRLQQRGWKFYTFIGGAARFMFAWDSDRARIDALVRDIRDCA
jgi:threonine aldolase